MLGWGTVAYVKTDLNYALMNYNMSYKSHQDFSFKVKSFYKGKTEYPLTDSEKVKSDVAQEKEYESNTINLPLVDVYAQRTLRKRIVLDRLNRM